MKIVWSEGAYADYDEILDYLIRDFGLQSASDFQAKLDYNIGMLKEFPLVGYLEYTNPKTREIVGTAYKNGMKSLQRLKYDFSQHTTDGNTFRDTYNLVVGWQRDIGL